MKAGDVKDITCSVGGGSPAPNVKVIVEDRTGSTVQDLTKNFEMTHTVSFLYDNYSVFNEIAVLTETPIETSLLMYYLQ